MRSIAQLADRARSHAARKWCFGAAPITALALLLSGCEDRPLPLQPEEPALSASAAPTTVRTGKGDLITGDAAAFAEALKAAGADGQVLIWIKETSTPRPSPQFFLDLPSSGQETIALPTDAPAAPRRNTLGPPSARAATVDAVVRALGRAGVSGAERMRALPVIAVRLPENARAAALQALLRHPNVDYVSAVRARPVTFLAAPVGTNPIDTKHTVHRIPQAWDYTRGSGAKIGIMDSGIARNLATGGYHDDAANVVALGFVDDECGTSTANYGGCPRWDDHGHGTAMVGLAGATDNNLGYVGIAPFATTYSLKVAWNTYVHGDCGSWGGENKWCIEDDDFVRTIDYAASRRLHVLSMSFSESGSSDIYRALATARNSYGVFLVAATGNTVGGSAQQPASYDVVMGVGGVDAAGNNLYSTAARDVSGFAGGATMNAGCYNIYTYCDASSPSGYTETGGTSAATANVAAIIGLIRSYHPYETVSQIQERLLATAEGPNRVVNAYAAITYRRPLAVGISGPSSVAPGSYETWYATVSGGTGPFSYTWYRDGQVVGTASSYSDDTGWGGFQLQVTVTDATGATATSYLWVSTDSGCNSGEYTMYPQEPCYIQ